MYSRAYYFREFSNSRLAPCLGVFFVLLLCGIVGIMPDTALAGQLPKADTTFKQFHWGALGDVADDEFRLAYLNGNEGFIGGAKYWGSQKHGEQEDWCVDFVTYCAARAGYVEWGNWPGPERLPKWAPQCNTVSLKKWYLNKQKRGVVYDNDGTYIPRRGDIAIRHVGKEAQHTGVVSSAFKMGSTWYIAVVEGNTGSNDTTQSVVNRKKYAIGVNGKKGWTQFITPNIENKMQFLIDVSKAKSTSIASQWFTSSPIRPSVTVWVGGKELKTTCRYKNNTYRGNATVTVYGPSRTPHGQKYLIPIHSSNADITEKKFGLPTKSSFEKKFTIFQPAIVASSMELTSPTKGKNAASGDTTLQMFKAQNMKDNNLTRVKKTSFVGYGAYAKGKDAFPVYWLQSKYSWRHNWFTVSKKNYDQASSKDYIKKGIAFYASTSAGDKKIPVYRMYKWVKINNKTKSYDCRFVYAITNTQVQRFIKEGYKRNGVAFYVWS